MRPALKRAVGLLKARLGPSEIDRYLKGGRIPWSRGYKQYRFGVLSRLPHDRALLDCFARGEPLPSGHGIGLDERIVEYPWLLSRLSTDGGSMMDGGSALNYPFLLDAPQLSAKRLVIVTLAPESTMLKRANVSYIFGDLRDTLFRDGVFDAVVSISTLEHVGMDNTKLYSADASHRQAEGDDYLQVIAEFRRLLKPGGRLLLTVPFGQPQQLDWLYQFDAGRLRQAIDAFGPATVAATYYRYRPQGWELSDAAACADCEYFDVHSAVAPAPDLAAAARAVACLELVKHA